MDEKTKILVGVIADLENDSRVQDDELEELNNTVWEQEDTIKGLTIEKLEAAEAYHKSIVEKDTEIARLKEKNNNLDIEVKSGNAATKEVFDILKSTGIEAKGFGLQSKIKSVIRKLQSTIKEREAEANTYRDLYNELKKEVWGDKGFIMKKLSNILTIRKAQELHKHVKLYLSWFNKEKAKASKLNAEKLAYMRILREESNTKEEVGLWSRVFDKYRAYLKHQAKKRRGGK
jgi:hypothetical protein